MDWLATGNNTCPLCRAAVTNSDLKPAHELRRKLGLDDVDTSDEEFRQLINVVNAASSHDGDEEAYDMGLNDYGGQEGGQEEEEVPCCARVLISCCRFFCLVICVVILLVICVIAAMTFPFWIWPALVLGLMCLIVCSGPQAQA